jgi:hypothetical protein
VVLADNNRKDLRHINLRDKHYFLVWCAAHPRRDNHKCVNDQIPCRLKKWKQISVSLVISSRFQGCSLYLPFTFGWSFQNKKN